LVKGHTINQKRLDELQQTVQLIQKSISSDTNLPEAKGPLEKSSPNIRKALCCSKQSIGQRINGKTNQ
jgi:hypothetical protein